MKDLILLHGALGSKRSFDQITGALGPFYKVHILDFPGHGESSAGDDFGIERFVMALKEYIAGRSLTDFCIFGYSMGGFVALRFAAENPAGLEKLVTLGTKLDWSPEGAEREIRNLDPQMILEKVPEYAAALQEMHTANDWKVLLRKTAGMMKQLGEEYGISREAFARIDIPVLLCRGSEDKMVSRDETEKAAGQIKNGRSLELEGVIHPIEKADPELLVKTLRSFI